MNEKTVFISYSHDSTEHSDRVLEFSNTLRSHGIDVELDRYQVRPSKGWPHWCEEQLRPENSEFVLMVCTEIYLKRIQDKVLADEGRGVFWEGGIIYDYLYEDKGNTRFIPILFSDGKTDFIPPPVRNHTRYKIKAFDLTDEGYRDLYRELSGQLLVTKPPLGHLVDLEGFATNVKPLETRPVKTDFQPTTIPTPQVDISRMIKYAPAELIGRDAETKLLTDTWTKVQQQETSRLHILTFVALGGEGKTSLVTRWAIDEMLAKGWPGCEAVFAWSFYSQGTREQTQASSDTFLKEALVFFGDQDTANSAASAFDKGRRLAHLIGERRALLILDGVEPLQYAPGPPMNGKLKDDGVACLLKGLAANNRGLCIVTTRYAIPDLRAFTGKTVTEEKLSRLSRNAGVHLLQKLEVKGSLLRNIPVNNGQEVLNEFEKLVEDVKGHALTLNLLGTFLRDAHAGDIRKRDLVKLEEADYEEQSGHAFHVMDAYVTSFKAEGEKGTRALSVLRLLGLFDRPATADCLNALWTGEEIGGLTGPLIGISQAQRNLTLKRLQDAGLITVNRDDGSEELVSLDAHPLLREYFAARVRKESPDAWRAAHRQLYEYLRDTTNEGDEPTLEDLQPLYQAVVHGCQAGLQQEVYDDVHYKRIRRAGVYYSLHKLGAFASDLGAMACFFEKPWSKPVTLRERSQASVLGQAAYLLRALGRLNEAREPMRAALELGIRQADWKNASIRAGNLSELELALGEIAEAISYAERSLEYADRKGDALERLMNLTIQANTLNQAGRPAEAESCFRKAEQVQQEIQPNQLLLFSVQGYQYCDLLLIEPEIDLWRQTLKLRTKSDEPSFANLYVVVTERAQTALQLAIGGFGNLIDIAINHLMLGRIAMFAAILNHSDFRFPPSDFSHVEAAVSGLRRAGTQHMIPLGLLNRAWLTHFTGLHTDADNAQTDLDEAWEIAERGPMRLHMADIHLYRARLFHNVKPYPWNRNPDGSERGPKDDLKDARKLIEQCGYWRRKEELEDAEEAAKNW